MDNAELLNKVREQSGVLGRMVLFQHNQEKLTAYQMLVESAKKAGMDVSLKRTGQTSGTQYEHFIVIGDLVIVKDFAENNKSAREILGPKALTVLQETCFSIVVISQVAGRNVSKTDIEEVYIPGEEDLQAKISKYLEDYSNSHGLYQLAFSNEFTGEERKIIHEASQKLKLKTKSFGKDTDWQIVVSKKLSPWELVELLLESGDVTENYQLLRPTNLANPSPLQKASEIVIVEEPRPEPKAKNRKRANTDNSGNAPNKGSKKANPRPPPPPQPNSNRQRNKMARAVGLGSNNIPPLLQTPTNMYKSYLSPYNATKPYAAQQSYLSKPFTPTLKLSQPYVSQASKFNNLQYNNYNSQYNSQNDASNYQYNNSQYDSYDNNRMYDDRSLLNNRGYNDRNPLNNRMFNDRAYQNNRYDDHNNGYDRSNEYPENRSMENHYTQYQHYNLQQKYNQVSKNPLNLELSDIYLLDKVRNQQGCGAKLILFHNTVANLSAYQMLVESAQKAQMELNLKRTGEAKEPLFEYELQIGEETILKDFAENNKSAREILGPKALTLLQQTCFSIVVKTHLKGRHVTRDDIEGTNLYDNDSNDYSYDRKGMKMMRNMGWYGQGLGKYERERQKPLQVTENLRRFGLSFGKDNSLDQIQAKILKYLETYTMSPCTYNLIFSNEFSTDERKIIHEVSLKLKLKSKSFGKADSFQLVVSKKLSPWELVEHLLASRDVSPNYQLLRPSSMMMYNYFY